MRHRSVALGGVLFVMVLGCFVFPARTFAADNDSWISSETLNLTKFRDLMPGEALPYSLNGNRDCTDRKIITRPASLLPIPLAEQSHVSCTVDTAYGTVSASGYLQRPGTTVSGPVAQVFNQNVLIIPIPRLNVGLHISGVNSGGAYLGFITELSDYLSSTALFDGRVEHKIAIPSTTLADASGQPLVTKVESMSFSDDGSWMVVDAASIGTVRVNTRLGTILPFGDALNYNIGAAPSLQTTITSSGRYAAVASKDFTTFRLYDLSTCGPVPSRIITKVNCQSRDLFAFMKSKVNGFIGVSTLRFMSEGALSMYAIYNNGSGNRVTHFLLTLSGADTPNLEYLAMGDSFASGEGAYQYKAMTDTNDNKCHLSFRSYPYLIASRLSLNQAESVACSGAKIEDIQTLDQKYDGQVRDNVERKDRDVEPIFSGFYPGYIAQTEFMKKHRPKTITISTVGNDIGFVDKIKRCLEPDTCFSTYEDRLEIVRQVNSQFDRLVDMYKRLRQNSLPQTKIYVVGYPQLAKPGSNCALNVHLNDQEIIFSELLINYLNSVIHQAANKAGVAFVNVEDALHGHRLCETSDPESIAVNGLTAGNDFPRIIGGPIGNESYHPNQLGQQLLAGKIERQTTGFTLPMPQPDTLAQSPTENASLPILQAPKSGRALRRLNYDDNIGNDIIYRQQWWQVTIDTATNAIPPLKLFKVLLNSEPLDLGDFTSDASGNLSFQIKLPETVPVGFHTIHVLGTNLAGEPIDVYKTVYVAASNEDHDGDGTPNVHDSCAVVEPSGTDIDQDTVDDACDGWIGPTPLRVTPIRFSTISSVSANVAGPRMLAAGTVTLAAGQTVVLGNSASNLSSQPHVASSVTHATVPSHELDKSSPNKQTGGQFLAVVIGLLGIGSFLVLTRLPKKF